MNDCDRFKLYLNSLYGSQIWFDKQTMGLTNTDRTDLTFLLTAIEYLENGEESVDSIRMYLESNKSDRIISSPITKRDFIDTLEILLWSYLVVKFGNYGTSPKVGHLTNYHHEIDDIIEILRRV